MKTHEFTAGETISTAKQARELLIQVGSRAVQQGEKYYDRYTCPIDDIEIPQTIAAYLPSASTDTVRLNDSVDIQWTFDAKTGAQKDAGIVGIVAFTRENETIEGATYITHLYYSIYSRSLDSLTLERLVIHGEHGLPTLKKSIAELTTNPLGAWTDHMNKSEMSISAQRKLGLLDVSEHEADELTYFVTNIEQ